MAEPNYKKWGDLLSIGIMLPACVGIGYGIGFWIDRWMGMNAFKIAGILFGMAAGLINVFRIAKEFDDDDNHASPRRR